MDFRKQQKYLDKANDDSLPVNKMRKLSDQISHLIFYCGNRCTYRRDTCPKCPISASVEEMESKIEKIQLDVRNGN